MPSDDVGIWAIFSSITALVFLLDFGFNSSFTRNISYIYSGVNQIKRVGFDELKENSNGQINYSLLKGMIHSMRWYYSRAAVVMLALLLSVGTIYINMLLKNYHGSKTEVIWAWIFFCFINTYNLYTLYYDALLEGKGLIKTAKQIIIVSQLIYLTVATILILLHFRLIAIVLAQIISIVITRYISYRVFFTKELKQSLKEVTPTPRKTIITAIYPNATKYGITSVGGFMIQKSSIFIGSAHLSLSNIANFGITKQVLDTIVAVSAISLATYFPKITKLRVEGKKTEIKKIYIKGALLATIMFIASATGIIMFGNKILSLLNSHTQFAKTSIFIVMALSSFIGLNGGMAGAMISTSNKIPFVKASIFSGIATVILLSAIFKYTTWGLMGMAIAPGLIDLCYQAWKWPKEVIKELAITLSDCKDALKDMLQKLLKHN